jgi:hypothetical protein
MLNQVQHDSRRQFTKTLHRAPTSGGMNAAI